MNKKIINLFVLFLMAGMILSCSKDEDKQVNDKLKDLPKTAADWLESHFNSEDVFYVKKEFDDGKIEYEVVFKNGTEIDFDQSGDWTSVDGNGNIIPSGLIPEKILTYVEANFPNLQITKIEKEFSGYEIKLTDGKELKFDKEGNFIRFDN